MAITPIATFTTTKNGDDQATNGTIVVRDSAGGIFGKLVSGTQVQSTGVFQGSVGNRTTSFTAGANAYEVIDATGGAITVTLPTASTNAGVSITFTKSDASGNAITLTGVLGTSTTSTQYDSIRCYSTGSVWVGK